MKQKDAHCDASQTLRNAGLAKTTQRLAVLEKLIGAAGPLNVHDILAETRGTLKINRVTVYRILASFREGGIIREIEAGNGISYYEMACLHNPIHPHFHCRLCGGLICMPPPDPLPGLGLVYPALQFLRRIDQRPHHRNLRQLPGRS
jgi:Fur family transcriptional regulator, ferric uptake regulator